MSVTLSSADLEKLARAIQVLASPLDYPHVDAWRSAVNRTLRELLHADSAGFLMPVAEGLALHSDEHDPEQLAAYPGVVPPSMADGTPLWEQIIRNGVGTLAGTYGPHYDRYLGSAYYQEYAGANGAHDTLYAGFSLGGRDALGMACLHLWHARPDGRLFGEREVALLRLAFPAFRAGVETQLRWGGARDDHLHMLDSIGDAAVVCDLAGRTLHRTPTLGAMLEEDPEREQLEGELRAMADSLRPLASSRAAGDPVGSAALIRELCTAQERYRLRGCLYAGPSAGAAPVVLVILERLTSTGRLMTELRAAHELTAAEARVAMLIARGLSNDQVAQSLFISPHTARRHTERVLRKFGVRSRAEVAAAIHARAQAPPIPPVRRQAAK